jgi:hypothetical protein
MGGDQRRWKESGGRESVARNGVGEQNVRQRNDRACEHVVRQKRRGLCFSWS